VAPVGAIQPRDLATYELYLEGRYFLGRRTSGDLRRAAAYFEQAVARDPAYPQAYAGLADARMLLVLLADGPPREDALAPSGRRDGDPPTRRLPKPMRPATFSRRSTDASSRPEPAGDRIDLSYATARLTAALTS
jgi:hypothetical protein